SSGIRHLSTIYHPICFKPLNASAQAVAFLPESEKPFLLTLDNGRGRVVIIGDALPFDDSSIQKDDNLCLVKNIFRWLAYQNFLDFGKIQAAKNTLYDKPGTFFLELANTSFAGRLENLQCQLESDASVTIDKPLIEVPPILHGQSTQVSWAFTPHQLGDHNLILKVIFPEDLEHEDLTFNALTTFQCVPDADISLAIHSGQTDPDEQVEVNQSFDIEALVRWNKVGAHVPLTLRLECSSPSISIKTVSEGRWRLKALDIGNFTIKLSVEETGQQMARLLYVIPSPKFKITQLERSIISELDAKVRHHISNVWQDFDVNILADIPFQLLTPEEFISLIYPAQVQERLFDILRLLKNREGEFVNLLDLLLKRVAPLYSPIHGCCIPYAPDLA
ncbi:MAG: hypothetical protein AAFN93_28640, partial [Bacteroidota bacterium]